MLSACFVLPLEDSIADIMETARQIALVQRAGGGTGVDLSKLRPRGSIVHSSGGTTEGPLSFLRMLSAVTDAIQQGAFRRGANMGTMRIDHPDILSFVRINTDGSIPADNPFVGRSGVRPEIWSIGHRNVQGATLHPETGELWEVEHGTRGGDELNVARKGLDYGWPAIAYGVEYQGGPILDGVQARQGMEQPRYYWDPVIAPGGMTFYTGSLFPAWRGSLFIGGLGSTNLVRLSVDGDRVTGEERLLQDLQPQRERIRDVVQGPDGALYVLTDGGSGRLLRLVPRN
jgi:glucose/arabinose dehydrogenase